MKAGRAKCGIIGEVSVRILSESSGIKLAKTRKTADLQWSKMLDIFNE